MAWSARRTTLSSLLNTVRCLFATVVPCAWQVEVSFVAHIWAWDRAILEAIFGQTYAGRTQRKGKPMGRRLTHKHKAYSSKPTMCLPSGVTTRTIFFLDSCQWRMACKVAMRNLPSRRAIRFCTPVAHRSRWRSYS